MANSMKCHLRMTLFLYHGHAGAVLLWIARAIARLLT